MNEIIFNNLSIVIISLFFINLIIAIVSLHFYKVKSQKYFSKSYSEIDNQINNLKNEINILKKELLNSQKDKIADIIDDCINNLDNSIPIEHIKAIDKKWNDLKIDEQILILNELIPEKKQSLNKVAERLVEFNYFSQIEVAEQSLRQIYRYYPNLIKVQSSSKGEIVYFPNA